jgi:OOP family OmpA-OmpF porin
MKLSRLRAQAVMNYLVSQGVKGGNLTPVGYGESTPIATNDTQEGKAMNRRVEIKLLSK